MSSSVDVTAHTVDHPTIPCAGRDEWTSESRVDRRSAVLACAGCPVFVQCGDGARQRGEFFGVWGGIDRGAMTGRELAAERRPRSVSPVDVNAVVAARRRGLSHRAVSVELGLREVDVTRVLREHAPELSGRVTLTGEQRRAIAGAREAGGSLTSVAREFGVSVSQVQRACRTAGHLRSDAA